MEHSVSKALGFEQLKDKEQAGKPSKCIIVCTLPRKLPTYPDITYTFATFYGTERFPSQG